MEPHHQQSLLAFVESIREDAEVLAVLTSGSVAQGRAKAASDVDVYVVITDEAFDRREAAGALSYTDHEKATYEGGYIDVKMIPLRFLEMAAERGSEPTRASFIGSQVAYSRIANLDSVIAQIPQYPEANRITNIRDFQTQLMLYGYYFAGEAAKKDDPYLLAQCATQLVLYGCRIVLAHNRILFPCHKSLLTTVATDPEQPADLERLARELLEHPTAESCAAFAQLILGFRPLEIVPEQALTRFIQLNEWNWMDQAPPLQDR